MAHPIHLHGQRFLVLTRDGVRSDNLVWKDTAIIPAGETVELLVDMSNPGTMDDALSHRRASERGHDGGVRRRVGQGIPPNVRRTAMRRIGRLTAALAISAPRVARAQASRRRLAPQARTLSPAFASTSAVDAPVVAIMHAKLIDGTGTPAKNDQTILIRGEKIAAVGPAASVTVPRGCARRRRDRQDGDPRHHRPARSHVLRRHAVHGRELSAPVPLAPASRRFARRAASTRIRSSTSSGRSTRC